jgi:predicted dehydrogenase
MVPEYSNSPSSSAPVLRVGVIGAAGWAKVSHLPALTRTPGLRLTAVSTTRPESARQVAAEWGVAHHFSSAADLARCADVDLITISVKAPEHRRLIEQVVGAGKPVLCEWPLGTSASETRYLADLLAARGIPAFVGLQATAHPVLREVGRLVREGYIGNLLAATLTSSRARPNLMPARNAYTLHTENGAGMVQILGGHSIAALATAAGQPLGTLSPTSGVVHLIQPLHVVEDGAQITATSPDSATAAIPIGSIDAAVSLADGDIDPRTTVSLVGTKGRIDAITEPSEELRRRQPQMADWVATITTNEARRKITTEPHDLPLTARNPARLYEAIRSDLNIATATAPTTADAISVHEIIDSWLIDATPRRR